MARNAVLVLKTVDLVIQVALITVFSMQMEDFSGYMLLCFVIVGWQFISMLLHLFVKKEQKNTSARMAWIAVLLWLMIPSLLLAATIVFSFISLFFCAIGLPLLAVYYIGLSIAELVMLTKQHDDFEIVSI
jgi:hypothetical protein